MALAVISLKWVHREIHGKPPSPRQGHSACVVGSVAYIFGGIRSVDWPKKGTYFFRDLFQLHLYKRMQWEKVKQKGEIPKGRYGHHMCVIGHKIYLFGGKHELHADKCLPGLHVYDTEKKEWSQPQTSGTEPEAHGSTSSVVGTRIYVYGGLVDGQAVDDLHCFDSENQWWIKLTVQGVPPSPRCDSASTAVGHEMFIFGGTAGTDKWFSDIHVFDTKKLLWKELNKTDGEPPTPRGNHCFLAHVDKDIYVFGGSNDSNSSHPTLGDLYKFSLDKRKWKRPFYGGCPPAKRSGHAAIIHRSKLIIIGGSNEDTDFNDVHVAKLINPSKRQPLKVPAGDMHEFLDTINNADPRPTVVDGEDAEAHFHEKEEAEEDPGPDPEEIEGSRDGHVNKEGPGSKPHGSQEDSVAGSDPDMKGGPGKSVHFEDEESEKQDGASLSSSAGSLSSSAGSLSSASSSSSGSSEGSKSSDSKGNTNNSNSNNSALGVRTGRQQDGIRRDIVKEVEERGSDGGLDHAVGRQAGEEEKGKDGKAVVAAESSSKQESQDNRADDSTPPIQPGKEKLAPISKTETKMSGAKQGKKAGSKKQKKKPKQETSNGTSAYETQLPPAGYRPYPPMEIPMQNWQRGPEEAGWNQYPEDWRTQNQLHSPAHQPQERQESEEESESESESGSESDESGDSDDGGDDGGSQTEAPEVRNMNRYDDSLSSGRQGEDTKEEDESEDGDDGSDEDSDEEEGEDDDEEEEEGDEDESGSGTGSDSESGSGSEDESESDED